MHQGSTGRARSGRRTSYALARAIAPVETLESRTMLYAAPVGPELLIDPGGSQHPATAVEQDGDFIVTWTEYGQNTTAIHARIHNPDGTPRGDAFRVSSNSVPQEERSAVAVDADGDFVIVWLAPSGSDTAVYARRFDRTGAPSGEQFRVGEFLGAGWEATPDVAMSAGGTFAVVWRDLEPVGRLYDASGNAAGPEFALSSEPFPPETSDLRGEHNPAVAMEPDGDFVVAWQRDDGFDNRRILARRFDETGAGLGANIEVDSPFRNDDSSSTGPGPDVAVDEDGDFLVAWQSYTGSYGIYGRRFTSAGAPQGDTFLVGTLGENPALAMDAAGHAVITWTDYGGVLVKQYDPAGNSVGATQYVNTSPVAYDHPAVAANASGHFVVAWVGDHGVSPGIFGQRFAPVVQEGSVGDFVWRDADADGEWDDDEPGIDGVAVKLYNASGALVGTTKTIAGHYRFDHVRPGEAHTLEIVLPEGMLLSPTDVEGSEDDTDSDFAYQTGRVTFTLAPNQVDLSIDAGLMPEGTISGVKFSDTDGDGVRDLGEPRLSGWVIYDDANNNAQLDAGEQSVVTDANGAYTLRGLRPTSHTVREVAQPLWNGVAPSSGAHLVNLQPGEQVRDLNFASRTSVPTLFTAPDGASHLAETSAQLGNLQPAVAIADNGNYVVAWMVANTEIGGLDVVARLFHSSGDPLTAPFMVHSSAAGNQTTPSVAMTPGGMFVIAWESQPGAGDSTRIEARAYGVAGQPISNQLVVSPVTGRDHSDPEVAVNNVGDFVVAWDTDANAQQDGSVYARLYNAKGVPKTDAFVVDELSGYSIGDASVAMDSSGDWVVSWFDLEPGDLTGIHAQLYNIAGQAVGDRIDVHEPLTYGAAHDLGMDDEGNFIVFSEGTIHRYDAQGRRLSAPIKVERAYSGVVSMDDDGGFVLFTQGEFQDTISVRRFNAAGVYTETAQRHRVRPTGRFAVAMNGDGDVVTAWSSHDEQCCSSSVHVQRFHDVQPATVSGVVWEDLNGNGIREEGEPTIDNVQVALADPNGFALSTTRTRDGGRYHFHAVPGMTYTMWADPPHAMVYTAANQGGDDTRDSDVDPNTRLVPAFMLAPGASSPHIDFGVIQGAGIAGLVFDDADADGTRDDGEPGLGGRVVYLDDNDNGQLDTGERSTQSDENGIYVLSVLRPGTYHVRQGALPGGWTQTSPAGAAYHVTLQSAQYRGDLHFGNRSDSVVPPPVRFVPHRTASDDAFESAEIVFGQPVTGFEVSDLKLTRFSDSNLLGPGQTLTTSDNRTFVLGNLAGVTYVASQYLLEITGEVVDSNGQPFSPFASDTFVQPATVIPGTAGDDTFYVMLNRARNEVQVFDHEPTEGSAPIYTVGAYGSSFAINGGAGNDRVIVDAANGLPHNAVTIAFDGGDGGDEVVLRGSVNEDRFAADEWRASVGNFSVSYDGVESIGIDGRGGDDVFSIESSIDSAVTFDAGLGEATVRYSGDAHGIDASKLVADRLHLVATDQAHLALPNMPHLRSLDLSRSAEVLFHGPAEQVLRVDGISITHDARLGIWDGTLIVTASPETREALLDYLSGLVREGRITSELAGQPNQAIVVTRNPGLTTYNGHAVGPDDILVKATWQGDANLDGRVDADDYFRIDQGFLAQPQDPGYGEGDFNGDERVNADDYFLIDQSFLSQPNTSAAGEGASAVVNADGDDETASKQRRKRIARTPFAVDRPVRTVR